VINRPDVQRRPDRDLVLALDAGQRRLLRLHLLDQARRPLICVSRVPTTNATMATTEIKPIVAYCFTTRRAYATQVR